jgi:sialate O-acetylesterase
MKMEQGLFDHMVVQRNRRGVSEAAFAGRTHATGEVRARVTKGGKALQGFADVAVGGAAGGRFSGCLRGLPAGGPYQAELRVVDAKGRTLDQCRIEDVLVGDVWVLGGQSNMEGIGRLEHGLKPHPLVRVFHMDDRWAVAKDPIHRLCDAVDAVHTDLCGGVRPRRPDGKFGVGPGLSFGLRMRELAGVPQGLIACAHGGTSMSQWNPDLKRLRGKSLYGAMLRRFQKNGGRVAGVVWYQGCSDANAAAPLYTQRMKSLVAAVRRDFGDKDLPFVAVQISRVVGWPPDSAGPWNSVQEQQRRLSEAIRRCLVVPAIDLSLDDSIHVSGRDQARLGARLAQAMAVLKGIPGAGKPPIALKAVTVGQEAHGMADAIVEFEHVTGWLRAGSRPTGFTLIGEGVSNLAYDVELKGGRAFIHTMTPLADVGSLRLHYGFGVDPYCNIVDEADRSLPVFGPVCLGRARAITPFVRTLRVSRFQPGGGRLEALGYPRDLARLGLRRRTFTTSFCDLHLEIADLSPKDQTVFFVCGFECPEPMRLAAVLGYDGPMRAWIDGRPAACDPEGTNPATPEKAAPVFRASRGRHELVLALGTNEGRAWGVFVRFERLDVPRRLINKGPEHYLMPKVLG